MKNITAILVSLLFCVSVNAQTATNFTCNDCNGVSHDLFTELDNGNVIVLLWVMPCASCIPGGLTCSNVTATYPSNVKFYMADDEANTVCSSLASWAANNNIYPDAMFSDASIDMLDYGSAGMPKAVVIGGASHTVFFNANNTINPGSLQTAINQALLVSDVKEESNVFSSLNVYPNPATEIIQIKYSLTNSAKTTVELYNLQGQIIQSLSTEGIKGDNSVEILTSQFPSGLYLIKVTSGKYSQFVSVVISHE